ncbi:hypothetical protein VTI74DRAFT_4656 [Chaetomium olivicolor]
MAMVMTVRALEGREPRIVTQTITRPSTTIIAVVTLGDGPTSAPSPTTAPPSPTPTEPIITSPPSSSTLTPQQLGALLGCILGLAFFIMFICCCFSFRRRPRPPIYEEEYDSSESEVVQVEVLRSSPEWNLNSSGREAEGRWATVPPPVHFPPTPRYMTYWQTREAQIPGVGRYP